MEKVESIVNGRGSFQNYQGREGAPTVLKGQIGKVLEKNLDVFA